MIDPREKLNNEVALCSVTREETNIFIELLYTAEEGGLVSGVFKDKYEAEMLFKLLVLAQEYGKKGKVPNHLYM